MIIKNSTDLKTLLTEYPQLRSIITNHLPDLDNLEQKQLKDNILSITTVEHVARKANLEPSNLIKEFQVAAGIKPTKSPSEAQLDFESADPVWIQVDPAFRIDGVEILSRGEHPLALVKSRLEEISSGDVIFLTTNFHPQPMIDAMQELGAEVFSRKDISEGSLHRTFIKKS